MVSFSYKGFYVFEVKFFKNVLLLSPVLLSDRLVEESIDFWSEDLESNPIPITDSLRTLGKLLRFFELQFPHLNNENNAS